MPDAVSRLRRVDEFDSNDEQGLDTDEVNDKAFEVAECKALPPVDVKMFFAKAVGMSDLDVNKQPGFEPLFALEHCTALKLVSVAVAQQRDYAVFSVNGLELLNFGSQNVLDEKSLPLRAHPGSSRRNDFGPVTHFNFGSQCASRAVSSKGSLRA